MTNLFNPWSTLAITNISLLFGCLVLPIMDGSSTVLSIFAINGASKATACAKHFENGALQALGVGTAAHGPCHVIDVIPANVTVVRDVLDLLAVTWGLLECLNKQCCRRGNDLHSDLAVVGSLGIRDTLNLDQAGTWGGVALATLVADVTALHIE